MSTKEIGSKIEAAVAYLTEHPDEARYTDSAPVARLEDDLRCNVTGPDDASIVTDMPPSVGGVGEHVSPGWLWCAAMASCTATASRTFSDRCPRTL